MSAPRNANASMCLEGLESRQLMSVTVTVNNGVMHIEGSNQNDNVMIDQDDNRTIFVFDDNILLKLVPANQVGRIEFDAKGGNDRLRTFEAVNRVMSVDAGDGDDIIETGSEVDTVTGGNGNDFIFTGKGSDAADGGEGNDTLAGGNQFDDLSGGNGNDAIQGGEANDTLQGNAGNDTLVGESGNDLLIGGADNDHLTGSAGRDTMLGGIGNDRFFARDRTKDVVDGGLGVDTAQVDKGFISIFFGRDTLIGIESSTR
jgi:Ca2+-binding RTX toxin-like protein